MILLVNSHSGPAPGDSDSTEGVSTSSSVAGSREATAESTGVATPQQGQLCQGLW